jgi:hypothetical protein
MFRHYRVVLRGPVINTLPSYSKYFKCSCWQYSLQLWYFVWVLCKISYYFNLYFNEYEKRSCIKAMWHILQVSRGWHDSVETCRSVIICEIIVLFLVHCTQYKNNTLYFFYVSLTVRLSITLANDQLNAQIFNTFITIIYMYMFRAISFSSSGGQIVLIQHLVSSLWKQVSCQKLL